METQKEFINIERGKISYGYHVYFRTEESGLVSSFIPAYKINYSSPDKDEAARRSKILVKSFFNFWVDNQGHRSFVLELHKLGFRAAKNHDYTLKELLNKRIDNAKFRPPLDIVPVGYNMHEAMEQNDELMVAI